MAPNQATGSTPFSSSGSKSNAKKAYNIKDYSYETETLRIQAKKVYEAAKVVHKEQKNIHRKLKKERSKQIDGCIDKYTDGLTDIRDAIERIESTVNKEKGEPELNRSGPMREAYASMRVTGTRTRKTLQDEASGGYQTDCFQCSNKEEKLKQLQETITGLKNDLKSLKEKIRSNEEREEKLQQKYQEEVNAKEEALISLNQIRQRENNLQRKCQEEVKAKEEAVLSLNQSLKTNEEKDLQRKYREKENAKEESARSLNQIRERENDLQRKYQEEVKAKEEAVRSLEQIRRSNEEREKNLERKYQDETNIKEEALRNSNQIIRANEEREKNLQRKYQEEVKAKEDALRSLEQIRRSNEEHEKNLQRKYQDEMNIKEEALRNSNQIIREHEEREKNLQREYQEEVNAKEDAVRKNRRQHEEYLNIQRKYQEEVNAKEDAVRRLSAMASSKLRDNNPNITDLSDQNRPTKIAEELSELYDNQWTDAFDVLDDEMQEEQVVQILLNTLMTVYHECRRLTGNENTFYERVQQSIILPAEAGSIASTEILLPNQLKQQLKEFRKMRATYFLNDIAKVVTPRTPLAKHRTTEVQEYLSRCVKIGWLCAVQDPPLVLSAQSPQKFDTNLFKDYTKRGKYVDYVVWPALFLSEGGALLSKGVAQGMEQEQTTRQ